MTDWIPAEISLMAEALRRICELPALEFSEMQMPNWSIAFPLDKW